MMDQGFAFKLPPMVPSLNRAEYVAKSGDDRVRGRVPIMVLSQVLQIDRHRMARLRPFDVEGSGSTVYINFDLRLLEWDPLELDDRRLCVLVACEEPL